MDYYSFRDMRIWQEAHALALVTYEATRFFPEDERFGLTSQMRRAASSVAANIAEGKGRRTAKDYVHFLYIAKGSTQEMLSHCFLAKDLGFLKSETAANMEKRYSGLSSGLQACISAVHKTATTQKASTDRSKPLPKYQKLSTP